MKKLVPLFFLLIIFSNAAQADGKVNGGKCYNGWHNSYGKCHPPHSGSTQQNSGSRYIKNGGHCYNDWFLDTHKNKCVKSRGLWGWLTD